MMPKGFGPCFDDSEAQSPGVGDLHEGHVQAPSMRMCRRLTSIRPPANIGNKAASPLACMKKWNVVRSIAHVFRHAFTFPGTMRHTVTSCLVLVAALTLGESVETNLADSDG